MFRWLIQRVGTGGAVSLGARGERLAERWLKAKGYRILERNYRVGHDEADLLVTDSESRFLIIVEVKTRRADHVRPEEHVNHAKQRCLARLALRTLKEPRFAGRMIRFDVIAIVFPERGSPEVRHIPGAFESPF